MSCSTIATAIEWLKLSRSFCLAAAPQAGASGRRQLIGSGMPTPAQAMWPPLTKPRARVVLVELEARRADVAAARPGVDRIVEEADCRAIFVEGHIAADKIGAVREPVAGSGRTSTAAGDARTRRPRRRG